MISQQGTHEGVGKGPAPRISEAPDMEGRFGEYGGVFVPETLIAPLRELDEFYEKLRHDDAFVDQLRELWASFAGRPTPLQLASRLTRTVQKSAGGKRGASIWLKREDLCHTGAHKINNALGQCLMAKKMGKKRVIAETGAGQHGVATATACAQLGLDCVVYMGAEDCRRQALNVTRMRMMGATVVPVEGGTRTLKDATNEAMRDWMGSSETTHYVLGSVVGPHPFPMIVRDFQSIIGIETKGQALRLMGKIPDAIVACVGGGSNAAGIFYPFVDEKVKLYGVEAGGRSSEPGEHAAPLCLGSPGVLHGSLSYVLQSADGQTGAVHSCSAGLDYPGVGPEHAYWKDAGRVKYSAATDREAMEAMLELARSEGILCALETAHAVHAAMGIAAEMDREEHLVICLSGRGDKDVDEASRLMREAGLLKD
ncbi:MAG: tryptophan synthase subunit beta [Phycisphaerales bacterium]|nr:MAG: tryptophan synthase subunit beta [Phycisphaerales bacterium]